SIEFTALPEVEDLLTRALLHLAPEEWQEVVAVDVDLPGLAIRLVPLLQLLDDVGFTRRGQERRQPVFLRKDFVDDRAGLDHTWPSDEHGHAEAALPRRSLLAVKLRHTAVWPGSHLGAVIGAVDDDGVLRDPQVVELLQHLTDH